MELLNHSEAPLTSTPGGEMHPPPPVFPEAQAAPGVLTFLTC